VGPDRAAPDGGRLPRQRRRGKDDLRPPHRLRRRARLRRPGELRPRDADRLRHAPLRRRRRRVASPAESLRCVLGGLAARRAVAQRGGWPAVLNAAIISPMCAAGRSMRKAARPSEKPSVQVMPDCAAGSWASGAIIAARFITMTMLSFRLADASTAACTKGDSTGALPLLSM